MPKHTSRGVCKCIQCNIRRSGAKPGKRRIKRRIARGSATLRERTAYARASGLPVLNPPVTTFRANGKMPSQYSMAASPVLVEVYRGVPIMYRLGHYTPDVVSATGGNVAMPRMKTLAAARRFVGLALKRGAMARDAWRPSVNPVRRVKRNPSASRVAAILSRRVVDLRYLHAEEKGQPYVHKFSAGVTCQLLSDGSVRLYRPDGKPIWKKFED